MIEIKLQNSTLTAIIDDSDFEIVSQYKKWFLYKSSYKTSSYARVHSFKNGVKKTIPMHRLILSVIDSSIHVDHANHNGLDNRRENIRLATRSQNGSNRRPYGESKYLGVHLAKSTARFKNGKIKTYQYWRARIKNKDANKYLSLGCYKNEIEAA